MRKHHSAEKKSGLKIHIARFGAVLGALFIILGLLFIGMYLWEGVIVRLGEPDQSPVFWYLPILFLGIFAVLAGVAIGWQALRQIRRAQSATEASDGDWCGPGRAPGEAPVRSNGADS